MRLTTDLRSWRWLILISVVDALLGCAGQHFRTDHDVPAAAPQFNLQTLPYREYWAGYVFNGDKIGFSRLSVTPLAHGLYSLRTDTSLEIRMLGFRKRMSFKTNDVVTADLDLQRFDHDYQIDQSRQHLTGERRQGMLQVSVDNGRTVTHQTLPADTALYPVSAIDLVPVLRGLVPGRRYAYRVYDGQVMRIADVEQEILAYENSDLFRGSAYRMKTRLHGQTSTTWIDASGRPVFETALGGVLISALEDEATAKRYLALASLNKRDVILDYSLVRPDRPIPDARSLAALAVTLTGVDAGTAIPSDTLQQCARVGDDVHCRIIRAPLGPPDTPERPPGEEQMRYLGASISVPSNDARIRATAAGISGGADEPGVRIQKLLAWMAKNIRQAPVDSFSALDVLASKQAECQGHAYLYTAFARSLGIPTKVVNGLMYSETAGGFLYHTWAESYVANRWLPVDPTFGQIGVDPTHIKLLEGEQLADLLPMVDFVGRIGIRIEEPRRTGDAPPAP